MEAIVLDDELGSWGTYIKEQAAKCILLHQKEYINPFTMREENLWLQPKEVRAIIKAKWIHTDASEIKVEPIKRNKEISKLIIESFGDMDDERKRESKWRLM